MKRSKFASLLMCGAIGLGSTSAFSDIIVASHTGVVDWDSPSQYPDIDYLYTDGKGFDHYSIRGRLNIDGALLVLDSDDSNDIIDEIIIYNSDDFMSVAVSIRDTSATMWAKSSLAGVAKIKANNPSNTDIRLHLLYMDGDVLAADPSDSIQVSNVEWIEIGGSIYGNIIARNDANPPSSNTDMHITVGGDLVDAEIINNYGGIEWLRVTGDATTGTDVWSSGAIQEITIDGSFEGRIGNNGEGLSGHPDVEQVVIGGDFTGSSAMTMNSLDGLKVGGDFVADITVSSPMDTLGSYVIDGEMMSGASISLPSSGLSGQVIINSSDNADAWDGDVVVGTTTLDASDPSNYLTYYTEVSSELGGGQVGLAPFNFHQRRSAPNNDGNGDPFPRDCDPYQSEAVFVGPSYRSLNEVHIWHYGPVYVTGSGPQFRVEFKSDLLPSSWVDRTNLFEVDTSETATSAITAQGDVVLTHTALSSTAYAAAGRWRIRPIAGKVKCGDVDGNPDVLWVSNVVSGDLGSGSGTQYSWYAFHVFLEATGGGMLMQGENPPSSSDIADWMEAPYEVNADGETDAEDLSDLTEAYGD